MFVRLSTLDDAEAVAAVHLAAWRETYPGIMPADILAALTLEDRLTRRREILASGKPGQVNLAAGFGSEIGAFADAGPSRIASGPADAELYAIYALKRFQGRGMGRALLHGVAAALIGSGYRSLILDVAEKNTGARAFYEAFGGTIHGAARCHAVGGFSVPSLYYVWPDLQDLVSATSPRAT